MSGTLLGNIAAFFYYLYFQFVGTTLIFVLFRREKPLFKLLTGSAAGSLLLTWLPLLPSFFCGFTLLSHILALLLTLPMLVMALRVYHMSRPLGENIRGIFISLAGHLPFLTVLFLFMIFWASLLHTHILLPDETGAIYTGQCTYGDMNMHLGFITSLARQGTFPPDYSIMPGVRLSYPFLSDSISSSLYLLGASLRTAYILPMLFAMAQILTAVYLFADVLFTSRGKSFARKAGMLACVLFFLNGGFGFAYFLDWSKEPNYAFSDIFTGFYTTPTNLVNQNIRWVNVIADIFLPQRASLFGYAVLFPTLLLLYRAAFQNRREYFPPAGLFAAGLPMIHTHSFLSTGVISAAWLLLWLFQRMFPAPENRRQDTQAPASAPPESGSLPEKSPSSAGRIQAGLRHPGFGTLAVFVCVMCLLQSAQNRSLLTPGLLMFLGIGFFAAAAGFGVYLLICYVKRHGWRELLTCWGVYLAFILTLALPQLLFWTFGQVAECGFVRGHFNWGNQGDPYLWFYLKNIGAPLLLIFGGICACGRKRAPLFLPALFLWLLGELIVFTPNTYDNNKILYAAYFLLCLGAAEYGVELYEKIKQFRGVRLFAAAFLFSCVFSALLTLGRETVSRYQLYSTTQTALAEYVEEHTSPDSVFLTGTRHNNEIASLTGRNIVCGADSFLYFHGLDTSRRKTDIRLMYEAPLEHMDLYEKYHVDYVIISAYERNSYQIDEAAFEAAFTEILSFGDAALYAVTKM